MKRPALFVVALLLALPALAAKDELRLYNWNKDPAIFPDKSLRAKLTPLPELTTTQRRLRNKLWTGIKAGR